MHTRLSVAIVTRNRARLLQKCLQSLIRQNSMPYEILIINNFSQDNTARVVQKYKKKLPIRNFLEKQIGIPYARNRALKEARGEIIAFIDDDCKATPTWVEEIIKAHKKHPNAAAIQGKSVSVPEDSIFACIQNTLYDSWIQKNLLKKNHIFVCDTKNVSFKKKCFRG